jgi:hypothetical protein
MGTPLVVLLPLVVADAGRYGALGRSLWIKGKDTPDANRLLNDKKQFMVGNVFLLSHIFPEKVSSMNFPLCSATNRSNSSTRMTH